MQITLQTVTESLETVRTVNGDELNLASCGKGTLREVMSPKVQHGNPDHLALGSNYGIAVLRMISHFRCTQRLGDTLLSNDSPPCEFALSYPNQEVDQQTGDAIELQLALQENTLGRLNRDSKITKTKKSESSLPKLQNLEIDQFSEKIFEKVFWAPK